jgi:hypothetical protein
MGAEKEREYLIGQYPGPDWKHRVMKMSDDQVIAIYLRKKQGEETQKKNEETEDKTDDHEWPF